MRTLRHHTRALSALGIVGALALSAVGATPAQADATPTVYAHRGGAGGDRTQENTLAAFEQVTAAHGSQGVWLEMDTQLTADGVLIVLHDDRLRPEVNASVGEPWNPTCDVPVINLSFAEVQACDEDVPSLAEVVDRATDPDAQWRLMIEIKNIPGEANFDAPATKVAIALIDLLADKGLLGNERIIVQSFWPPSLEVAETYATAAGSSIRSMLLTISQLAPAPVGFPAISNGLFSTLGQIDIVAPDIRSVDLDATTVAAIHAMGKQVIVWTVNDLQTIDAAVAWGVDGIITDHPGMAYAALGG